MPSLSHSPADVLRSLLVDLSLTSYPPSDDWPAHLVIEPNAPDDVVTLTDTTGRKLARRMTDSLVSEYPGVQVRVRSSDHSTGWTKAKAIEVALDESVSDRLVSVGSSSYLVHSVMRPANVIVNGKETLRTSRSVFTLNVLLDLKQTA